MPSIGLPAALAIGGGLAAGGIGAGLSAGSGRTTNTSQTAQFDPTAQAARTAAGNAIEKNLSSPLNLDPALLAQGLGNLNQSFTGSLNSLQNIASARGLGQSGLFGGNLTNLELSRLGGINSLINSLTGTAFERQQQSISQALQLGQPTGFQGQNTLQPSLAAGFGAGLGDISSTLGLLAALGSIGHNSTQAQSVATPSSFLQPAGFDIFGPGVG